MRIGLVIIALFLFGCNKETYDPVFNDFSLIGYWISSDGKLVLDVKDVSGKVSDETYFEYYDNGGRYVRRTSFGYPTTYRIIKITPDELQLQVVPNGTIIQFYRAT